DLEAGALLEAQATVIADEIAYDNHDIDDGLFSCILDEEELLEVELWRRAMEMTGPEYHTLPADIRRVEGVRRLINLLVTDVIDTSVKNIKAAGIETLDDVRKCRIPIICSSQELVPLKKELERFLFQKFYKHYRVMRMANKARHFLRDLFTAYVESPFILPTEHQKRAEEFGLHRAVADYIAGMTDRFAEQEYRKLFQPFE
ncbi:MAG: deoxyguanosinetriphosphate triphosphohydrolase, partial [Planctomycetes bacterium]|nr:deoxyguanosinetriphosphate triphosphohydrolase [Planctomycetota bacterium]